MKNKMSKMFFLGLFAIFSLQSAEGSDAKSASAAGAAQLSGTDAGVAIEEEIKAGEFKSFYDAIQKAKQIEEPIDRLMAGVEVHKPLSMIVMALNSMRSRDNDEKKKLLRQADYLFEEIHKLNKTK